MTRQRTTSRFPTLTTGMLSVALAASLSACSAEPAAESDDMQAAGVAPAQPAEFIPASAHGPAQNAPEPQRSDVTGDNTPAGAAATVEFFWEALDHGRLTGDTSHMEQVTHYGCELCSEAIYRWEKIHEDNAWADLHGTSAVTVQEVHTFPAQDDGDEEWVAVIFELTEPASDFYHDGERIDHETTEETTSSGWWAELRYEESTQQWVIEWIGYDEELIPDEET